MAATNQDPVGTGAEDDETREGVIDLLYKAVLRRVPDASGRATYSRLLRNGMPVAEIVRHLAKSQEFASRRLVSFRESIQPGIDGYDPGKDTEIAKYNTVDVLELTKPIQRSSMGRDEFQKATLGASAQYPNGVQQQYLNFHRERFYELSCMIRNLLELHGRYSSILDFGLSINSFLMREIFPMAKVSVGDRPQMNVPEGKFHQVLRADLEDDRLDEIDLGARFDIIVFAEVIEHLRMHPVKVIRFLLKHLTKSGHLIITTPNLFSRSKLREICNRRSPIPAYPLNYTQNDSPHFHFREYGLKDMLSMIDGAGGRLAAFYFSGCWDDPELRDSIPAHELGNMILLATAAPDVGSKG